MFAVWKLTCDGDGNTGDGIGIVQECGEYDVAWFAKCWCSFLDEENVIKGGIDDWVEDDGTVSQTSGCVVGVDIEVVPMLGELIRLLIGSRFEGERERVGVADVAVSIVGGKGDFDVCIIWEVMDDVGLLADISVSCCCKAPMDVSGSDTDPDTSIAQGDAIV